MALDLTALEAELTRNESVDDSAAVLLKTLFDEVEANKNNPAAIQAIVDRVRTANDKLTAAVAANTPGAPVEPPVDPPVDPNPVSARRR